MDKKNPNKSGSQQVSRANSKFRLQGNERPQTNLEHILQQKKEELQFKNNLMDISKSQVNNKRFASNHPSNAPKDDDTESQVKMARRKEIQTLQHSPKTRAEAPTDGSQEARKPLESLLQSRKTVETENTGLEAWNAGAGNQTDMRKLRNASELVQRKMQRTEMDRVKIARIPDDVFYDDKKMMDVPIGSYDKIPIDFEHYKQKLAGVDKNRPKLAELFNDRKSVAESLSSSQTRSRIDRIKRETASKTAMDFDHTRRLKLTPPTAMDGTQTAAPKGVQSSHNQLFPWENRMASIK